MAGVGVRAFLGVLMVIFMVAAAVFNLFVILTFVRVKRLRKAKENYMLISIAAVDLAAAVLWCLPTLFSVSVAQWLLGDAMCSIIGMFWTLFYVVNVHTMSMIAFERCLRICRPSKHEIIFTHVVTLILMAGMWVFDLVMAFFPIMGWSKFVYFGYQFQCNPAYEKSVSHLNFMFVFSFILPVIWNIVCYALIFHKVRKIRSRVTPGKPQQMILEENTDIPKESYAEKLQRQQRKFEHAPLKKKKPVIGKKKKVPTATLR